MKKLFDNAVEILINKRFSYLHLIIISGVEYLIITFTK